MIVTAWNNGGASYGIKVKANDRNMFFKREWKTVTLEFENFPVQAKANISKKSFWSPVCRELIKNEIGKWMQANGFVSWPKGNPPKLWLEPLSNQRFLLRRLTSNDK
jgi:hypothetical protein